MNVLKVNGFFEFLRIVKRYELSVRIQKISFPVAFVHSAEYPSVSLKVGKLSLLQLRIEIPHVRQEVGIGPKSAHSRALRVRTLDLIDLLRRQLLLLRRIHQVSVGLVVPPGVAEIRVDDVRSRM